MLSKLFDKTQWSQDGLVLDVEVQRLGDANCCLLFHPKFVMFLSCGVRVWAFRWVSFPHVHVSFWALNKPVVACLRLTLSRSILTT